MSRFNENIMSWKDWMPGDKIKRIGAGNFDLLSGNIYTFEKIVNKSIPVVYFLELEYGYNPIFFEFVERLKI